MDTKSANTGGRKLLPLRVGYIPTPELESLEILLRAACAHCGAELVRCDNRGSGQVCGVIAAGYEGELMVDHLPRFLFRWLSVQAGPSNVEFHRVKPVPSLYQGAVFSVPNTPVSGMAECQSHHTVLGSWTGFATWTTGGDAVTRTDHCWVPLEVLRSRDNVGGLTSEDSFCWLIPLLEWLRHVTEWGAWTHPPLRASIMFDDPNLHSAKYGFVDFAQLASEGEKHNYHSCFATVPFDSFYTGKKAVRVFDDKQQYLSLLIHGNNHTHRELAQVRSRSGCRAEARQALERIAGLERSSGLAVAKVMAPPHGACSSAMMEAMAIEGYEAACISHGSVIATNAPEPWTWLMGLEPCTVVHGLPIIPRFRLKQDVSFVCTRAAYLEQAIVPVGHHWDVSDGVDLLREVSETINSLGAVDWSNMSAIARSHVRTRVVGNHMFVLSHANRFRLLVPDGVAGVSIELLGMDWSKALIECSEADTGRPLVRIDGVEWVFSCEGSKALDVKIQPVVGPELVEPSRTPVSAGMRRVASEVRDRVMPFLPRRLQRH